MPAPAIREGRVLLLSYSLVIWRVCILPRSRALEAERELDRIYAEIERLLRRLRGEKLEKAMEIEGQIYLGKLTPSEALREIRKLAAPARPGRKPRRKR